MLKLIEKMLKEHGIGTARYDGTLTLKQKRESIEEFNKNEECCVFLTTSRTGGQGLNLTIASRVVLFDPWWNRMRQTTHFAL